MKQRPEIIGRRGIPVKPYTKEYEALYWVTIPDRQNPLPLMEPIPARASGSSYGACGVRIDGTPEFIDAVLSNLKDLIDGENGTTRLELARHRVDGSKLGKEFNKAAPGAEVCYIRLHERGTEAQMMHAMCEAMRGNPEAYIDKAQRLIDEALS